MRKNERLEKHIRRLGYLSKNAHTADLRRLFWQLYQDAKEIASENEDIMEELMNIYVRNPAFPGDMWAGWMTISTGTMKTRTAIRAAGIN